MRWPTILTLVTLTFLLTACAVNPVTGKRELALSSPQWELQTGAQQYQPALQSQGGDYRLDAKLSDYISIVGHRLAAKSDRPDLPWEFTVLNNSAPNAWALPGGKIAINRGLLLALNSESELAAVLGHEVVHAAARHGAQKMDQGLLMGVGIQLLNIGLGDHDQRDLIVGSSALGIQLIQSKYGRAQELEADNYGMDYMSRADYDPQGAVELQRTFVKLSQSQQSASFWRQLFASHPPSQERVRENLAKAKTLPNGDIGKAYYLKKTTGLRKSRQAYELHDKGRRAFAKDNATEALKLSDKAIAQLSRESLFHELRGLSLQQLNKNQPALAAFDRAIELNNHYFGHFLARGLLRKKLGKTALAQQDLNASQRLLPTATANEALGKLALTQGNKRKAYDYFSAAAQSRGAAGLAARKALLGMDLEQAPHKHLVCRLNLDDRGQLVVSVKNLASVSVHDILVLVSNDQQQQRLHFTRPLEPNQLSETIITRFTPTRQQLGLFRAAVLSAKVAD